MIHDEYLILQRLVLTTAILMLDIGHNSWTSFDASNRMRTTLPMCPNCCRAMTLIRSEVRSEDTDLKNCACKLCHIVVDASGSARGAMSFHQEMHSEQVVTWRPCGRRTPARVPRGTA